MKPTISNWYRVNGGPHRGKSGVCDLIREYAVGTRYRLTSTTEHVGWFAAEHLDAIPNPQAGYVSKVDDATTQKAMELLMAPRRAS